MWKGIRRLKGRTPETVVDDRYLPPPRPTRWALAYALLYLGLPILFVTALFDTVMVMVAYVGWGGCWGLYCLLD